MIDPNDLLTTLESLVNAYHAINDPSHPIHREALYWRERFLANAELPTDADKSAHVVASFLFTPSAAMMQTSPDEYFEELKRLYGG